jgi:Na+-translocating ferredoxin:NAD+ oxidoreductase RnfE subunit
MKLRLNIPGLVVAAIPGIPVFMYVIPPLLNASNTHRNLLGLALAAVIVLTWLVLGIKIVQKIRVLQELKKLLLK